MVSWRGLGAKNIIRYKHTEDSLFSVYFNLTFTSFCRNICSCSCFMRFVYLLSVVLTSAGNPNRGPGWRAAGAAALVGGLLRGGHQLYSAKSNGNAVVPSFTQDSVIKPVEYDGSFGACTSAHLCLNVKKYIHWYGLDWHGLKTDLAKEARYFTNQPELLLPVDLEPWIISDPDQESCSFVRDNGEKAQNHLFGAVSEFERALDTNDDYHAAWDDVEMAISLYIRDEYARTVCRKSPSPLV